MEYEGLVCHMQPENNGIESDENGRFVRDIRVEIPVDALRGLVTW